MSGVMLPVAAAVAIGRHQGDTDCDHNDPKSGCPDVGYEKYCAAEQQGHGDPDQRLPHGRSLPVCHEIYHPDAILEFPQSGERFEGVENFREWRRQYPADLAFHLRRIAHRQDLVVTEYLISYNGAPWMFTVSIMEFRGDRAARERIYTMDGFEPAEWRAPWRAERRADPVPPAP